MIILVAVLVLESNHEGCINHPEQADVLGAMAVEDMCDGHRKYVRRPSHEVSQADMVMGMADMEMGQADTEMSVAVLQCVDNECVPVILYFL
jgi:hypothetical protein